MFALGKKQLETRVIIKISPILATQETLTNFHGDEAKKIKTADSKKRSFF